MRLSLAAALGALVLVTACAIGDAVRPVLLTVSPAPPGAAAAQPAARQVIALRRVELPEYLLSRHVRYRDGSSTLAEWPDAVWAERLEIGVTRELAAALRQRLPGSTVCEGSCDGTSAGATLRVELSALDFRRAPGRLQVSGAGQFSRAGATSWTMLSFEQPAAGDTPQAHVEAIGTALGRVADAIVAGMRGAP